MTKGNRNANAVDLVVGSNLRMMRIALKMNQTVLGDQVGVTFQQIQKYEKGSNRIGASRMWQFCEILGCEPGDFFVGVPQNEKDSSQSIDGSNNRADLFQHPRGPAIAKAFLSLENPALEKQIIAMCRTLGTKKAS